MKTMLLDILWGISLILVFEAGRPTLNLKEGSSFFPACPHSPRQVHLSCYWDIPLPVWNQILQESSVGWRPTTLHESSRTPAPNRDGWDIQPPGLNNYQFHETAIVGLLSYNLLASLINYHFYHHRYWRKICISAHMCLYIIYPPYHSIPLDNSNKPYKCH